MPVKRRASKRAFSRAEEIEAWEMVFGTGRDFFGEAEDMLRLPASDADWRDRPEAREAWERVGADYLATFGEGRAGWALTMFGRPADAR